MIQNLVNIIAASRRRQFNPLSLSPALWLDGSDPNTLFDAVTGGNLVAPDGAVARWEDKSGNGRHATQPTVISRPTRRVGAQNNKDALRFDGLDDFLQNTVPSIATTSAEICVVAKSIKVNSVFVSLGPNVTNQAFGISRHTDGRIKSYIFGGTESYGVNSANFVVGSAIFGGGQHFIAVNGIKSAPQPATLLSIGSGYTVGALRNGDFSPDLQGDIAEILVFPTELSDTNRQAVENYLNAKWAIY